MPSTYVERLAAPWWLWMLAALFVLSIGLAFFVPFGPVAALPAMGVTGALVASGLVVTNARIEVTDGRLRAGRACIPIAVLGTPVVLDGPAARHARGPGFDPAGYHLLRGWIPAAVLVEVLDPDDPTPHWFLSTRHPEQLAAAIGSARKDAPR